MLFIKNERKNAKTQIERLCAYQWPIFLLVQNILSFESGTVQCQLQGNQDKNVVYQQTVVEMQF